MYAETARKVAEQVNATKVQEQYGNLSFQIDEAAKSGQFALNYFDKLLLEVKTILEQEGYVITQSHDQKDGYLITITW